MHSLEVINDDTIVSKQVLLPRFNRSFVIKHSEPLQLFDVRLDQDTIEVFVDAIHQKRAKFMAIVLGEIVELRREAANCLLQQTGRKCRKFSAPNFLQESSVGSRNPAAAAKGIFGIDFARIGATKKVHRQRFRVIQALHNRIQET